MVFSVKTIFLNSRSNEDIPDANVEEFLNLVLFKKIRRKLNKSYLFFSKASDSMQRFPN